MAKVLFILKRREDYNSELHSYLGLSTGLYNSAKFITDMLDSIGEETKLAVVTDNNDIDREVTAFRPTHVIIEALWVVPDKFRILQRLHPDVKWIIRLHSDMPFLANEGMAMDWLGDYSDYDNVYIGCNSPRMLREVRKYLEVRNYWCHYDCEERVLYLPNYYPVGERIYRTDNDYYTLDVGCFGAVRPMKNHLLQAHAAIEFAEDIGKQLRFHINTSRVEMKGQAVLNNLNALFAQVKQAGHELINHEWMPHEDFIKVCAQMDIGMQVSFSETFNIVAADLITQGVPIVASKEVPWAARWTCANPTDSKDMVKKLRRAYNFAHFNVFHNRMNLAHYSNDVVISWVEAIR